MTQKNGAIIHVERGYQIAEVVEEGAVFVGYRLIGPGAGALPVFDTEDEAIYALAQLICKGATSDPG